jgi:hypothetical protein
MKPEELLSRIETLQELTKELRAMIAKMDRQLSIRNSFIRALLDPDAFGYSVDGRVREEAYKVLQGERDEQTW